MRSISMTSASASSNSAIPVALSTSTPASLSVYKVGRMETNNGCNWQPTGNILESRSRTSSSRTVSVVPSRGRRKRGVDASRTYAAYAKRSFSRVDEERRAAGSSASSLAAGSSSSISQGGGAYLLWRTSPFAGGCRRHARGSTSSWRRARSCCGKTSCPGWSGCRGGGCTIGARQTRVCTNSRRRMGRSALWGSYGGGCRSTDLAPAMSSCRVRSLEISSECTLGCVKGASSATGMLTMEKTMRSIWASGREGERSRVSRRNCQNWPRLSTKASVPGQLYAA
mmetsp:Transcript_11030/g.19187  ORF Transcript_11030/g.19187 Transcript_11030/m.19187 type:complete len:283 (+) Transcript_11030:43-891(+)